jgi:bifunctional non-homologous end joining protein LigD
MIDGEAIAFSAETYDFHALRSRVGQRSACLIAFDLLDLNGRDLRPQPLESRRAALVDLVDGSCIPFSAEVPGDGAEVFAHACAFGLEGIVSKRRGSIYRSGRCVDWVKTKNPAFMRP